MIADIVQHSLPVGRLGKKTRHRHGARHRTEDDEEVSLPLAAVAPGMNSTHSSVSSFIRPAIRFLILNLARAISGASVDNRTAGVGMITVLG